MDSNRVRVSAVREATLGVTPATPRMRTAFYLSETLAYRPQFFTPEGIRSDRMNVDPQKINELAEGGLPFELIFPRNLSFISEVYRSAFYGEWVNTPEHFNDGTADSAITDFVATTGTFTVVNQSGSGGFAGSDYKAGHLVRSTGFGIANNNAVRKVTSSTATTVVVGASGTNETAPAAAARLKVVGFEGASGDITATASGLASTTLNFTTLGLMVGQWLKVGGSAAGNRFTNVAANNDWVRLIAIAANALTFDNLPVGWGVDAGTSKTIRVFFGDVIRNGLVRCPLSIEKAFLGQAAPTYVMHRGMTADTFSLRYETDRAVIASVNFMGMTGEQGTSAFGNTYEDVPDPNVYPVLTSNVSVAAINEAGAALAAPAWAQSLEFTIGNNLRRINAIGNIGAVALGVGDVSAQGRLNTYFGSNALYQKLLAGTVTNLSARAQNTRVPGTSGHALIHTKPRITFTDGNPNVGGKNTDVMLPLAFETSMDSLTACETQADRLEYFEM